MYLLPHTQYILTALANSIQEICGFVLEDGTVICVPNVDDSPNDSFTMAGTSQAIVVGAHAENIVAYFHTHPRGVCWPSARDISSWPAACSVGEVKYLIATTREVSEFRLDEYGHPKPVE